jgi:parvulin-like peptidyl-prolyl isomerase
MKRVFLAILMLGCLLWAEQPDPKAIIGSIGGKSYTYAEYNDILTKYFKYNEQQQGKPLAESEKATLNDRCWEEQVGKFIYDKAIKAGKIKITDSELLAEAKKNPPSSLRQIKELYPNGKFDKTKYQNALNTNADFRKAVLADVRSIYQYPKLLTAIRSEVDISADSVKTVWLTDHDLVDARIIFFDANAKTSINATEEEARAYYNERKEEYRKDNSRKLNYVHFTKVATAADSVAVKAQAWQMYQELLNGADFAEMAKLKSQDPGSGKNGGDLGWFGKGRMVPVFEEAAFKTPVGQITEPLLSKFGWHIIQVTDRRTGQNGDEVNARHILIKVDPSTETVQKMKTQSTQLYELARTKGLSAAASEMGLKLEETPAFQQAEGMIKGIGRDDKLMSFAFSNPEGTLGDLYYAQNGDAYVLSISAVLPVYYTPFEEDKNRIQASATRSKRGYYMNEYVQNFIKNVSPEQYFATAEYDSIKIIDITEHKKGQDIASIGKVDALDGVMFSTPAGEFCPLISEQQRWFLAQITKRTVPDLKVWEKDKTELISAARKVKQDSHLNDWYFAERQKAQVIDNRKDYYDLKAAKQAQQIKLGG